ncbi:MAG: hydrogenase maturation nickel metallochaperone HypA [Aquabacterium sp.]|jgi:hydrogenase nickel incorporation protein HypA/HybF|uniref:hydrogenase maturation nickel metallochaperone HypA/HybF n=1 Tax=Aquabacterium sp. TaxID=1872578 RepID=UPI0007E80796|nr:hydrogenase maturation nickel metallochaperone HypA [uncultured Aquabacterium sp.]
MHELSLAGGIVQLVEDAAVRERFRRVQVLRLEAGALSGVEVRALRFALESIVPGTCLAEARIEIDEPPAQAWCLGCNQSVPILSRLDPCPECGGARLQPTGGTELRVVDLLVDDEPATQP